MHNQLNDIKFFIYYIYIIIFFNVVQLVVQMDVREIYIKGGEGGKVYDTWLQNFPQFLFVLFSHGGQTE